MQEHDKNRKQS